MADSKWGGIWPRFSEEYPREWWERMKQRFFCHRIHDSDIYASAAACTNCGLLHSEDDNDCPNRAELSHEQSG